MASAASATIDETGVHVPTFDTVLSYFADGMKAIYGEDIQIDPDDMDGVWLGLLAKSVGDVNDLVAATYASFSPQSAVGTGLSSVVKVNGIVRKTPTNSTCDVVVSGVVGTVVEGCYGQDEAGYNWTIPDCVIGPTGQVVVTAVCQTAGAIQAPVGSINVVATPILGWQSITNLVQATSGQAVETDPQLKFRQTKSVALPSQGTADGIYGALDGLSGVADLRVYENDESSTDSDGIPGHCVCAVVDGGDSTAIAQNIALKKLSSGTYGDQAVTVVTGQAQIPRIIRFFRPINFSVNWQVNLIPLRGYTQDVEDTIANALASFTNSVGIGAGDDRKIMLKRAYASALLTGTPAASTFELVDIQMSRDALPVAEADVPVAFNERPNSSDSLVSFTRLSS